MKKFNFKDWVNSFDAPTLRLRKIQARHFLSCGFSTVEKLYYKCIDEESAAYDRWKRLAMTKKEPNK
jgi:hypothetical protein